MNPLLENLKKKQNLPIQEILDTILEDACKITESKLSYFAVMNEDEDVLTMIGWSKSAMATCQLIVKPIVYILEDTGLWGDAVRERKPVITNDYKALSKPTKKGYPPGHVDVKRHMNIPVFDGNKIVAVAGVGNRENLYTETQAKALTEYMNEAWKVLGPKASQYK